jgi:hypothetical protein
MYDTDTATDDRRTERRTAGDAEARDGQPRRGRARRGCRRRGRTATAGAGGPPGTPWLYGLVRDRTGQSTTVGVALMLAVATIGVTAVVALGGSALTDTQDSANIQRTEHAMTLLDSRGAMAALGEADSQQVTLSGSGEGSYEVDPDAGWIEVVHENYTDPTPTKETIYNQSLGAVRYTVGDTVIAYQGGGVWRSQDNGSVMVSPPEFHYRDQTLTVPLVRVNGSGSAAGRISATVSPESPGADVRRIYPNRTGYTGNGHGAPYDVGGADYDNPVANGTVVVTVHSEHYQGWATYFAQRTEGNLTVNHTAQTAAIELRTLGGAPGPFDMPPVGGSLDTPGVAQQHNVTEFTLTLEPDTSNANAFQQLHWSMYYQGPNGQQFELHFRGNGRCQSGDYNDEIGVSVYYRHNSSAPSEEWEATVPDPNDSDDPIYVDCSSDAPVLQATLVPAPTSSVDSLEMTYTDIDIKGSDNKWHFGNVIKAQDAPPELAFDQHAADPHTSPMATPYQKDDPDPALSGEDLDFLIDHYFSLLGPDFELTVDAGPGGSQNRVSEDLSSGELWYDTVDGEEYIQFLHITENEVRVELDG